MAAPRGELLAGRLVFSPGTRYLIISPCRCSGRGQHSVPAASLAAHACLHLWRWKLLPNVPAPPQPTPTNEIITPSTPPSSPISVTACFWSQRTLTDRSEPEPSPSDKIWILYILRWSNYLGTTFARFYTEASEFQLRRAFGSRKTAHFFRPN